MANRRDPLIRIFFPLNSAGLIQEKKADVEVCFSKFGIEI